MNLFKKITQKLLGLGKKKTLPEKKRGNFKGRQKKPMNAQRGNSRNGKRFEGKTAQRNSRNSGEKKIVCKTTPETPQAAAMPANETFAENTKKFANLGVADFLLAAINDMQYSEPTEIQVSAIPSALEGRDIIGTAQTGTGKTAAFALPVLQQIKEHGKTVSALMLAPTRELASQIHDAVVSYSKYTNLRCALIQGGVSMQKQVDELGKGADIIVATPGRIIDLMRQRLVCLKTIKYLVLDEVDRMFDMGFIEDVTYIIRSCPEQRQTLFFSATMPEAVQKLSSWALKDPVRIDIGIVHTPAETVEHFIYPVDRMQKYDMLLKILETMPTDRIIVFTRTRIDADRIGERVAALGYKVSVLHSDKSQRERDLALAEFKDGKTNILVATDIASRGLDISSVSVVINYNVPEHSEDYVHRIGRTGRAHHLGRAITLFSSDEIDFLRRIERFINAPIPRRRLEGFEYNYEPDLNEQKKCRKRNR